MTGILHEHPHYIYDTLLFLGFQPTSVKFKPGSICLS